MSTKNTYKIVRAADLNSLDAAVKLWMTRGYVPASAPYIVETDYAQSLVLRTALDPIDFPKLCTKVSGTYIGDRFVPGTTPHKPIYYIGDKVDPDDYEGYITLKDDPDQTTSLHYILRDEWYVAPRVITAGDFIDPTTGEIKANPTIKLYYKWAVDKPGIIDVDVQKVKMTSLCIQSLPRTHYFTEQAFEGYKGLSVAAFYNNGAARRLSESEYTVTLDHPIEITEPREYTATITYIGTEEKTVDPMTTTFKIVYELDADQTLTVLKNPTKMRYIAGEGLDLTGLVVRVTRKSGVFFDVAYPATGDHHLVATYEDPMTEVKKYKVDLSYWGPRTPKTPEGQPIPITTDFYVEVYRLQYLGAPILSTFGNSLLIEAGEDPDFGTHNSETYDIIDATTNAAMVTIGRLDLDDALYFSAPGGFTVAINGWTDYVASKPGMMQYGVIEPNTRYITWHNYTKETAVSSTTYNNMHRIYFRGTNLASITKGTHTSGITVSVPVGATYSVHILGNYEALIHYASLRKGKHPTLTTGTYKELFKGQVGIGGEIAPISFDGRVAVPESCFESMFDGCAGITSIPGPKFRGESHLGKACFKRAFAGCTGLTTLPTWDDPETYLAESCYEETFEGCTGLTTLPEPVSEHLAPYCYKNMFKGCTGLKDMSEYTLAAKKVIGAKGSCYGMFSGCTGMTDIPNIQAVELEEECFREMFKGCTGLWIWDNYGEQGPEGNKKDYDGQIRLFNRAVAATDCCKNMFEGCSGNPDTWTEHGTPVIGASANYFMVRHIPYVEYQSDNTFFIECRQKSWNGRIIYSDDRYHWKDWEAERISGTKKSGDTKYRLYMRGIGNTGLAYTDPSTQNCLITGSNVVIPEPSAGAPTGTNTLNTIFDYRSARAGKDIQFAEAAALGLFKGCLALSGVPQGFLPNTTVSVGCYYQLFAGTSITAAPDLPSFDTANSCYREMFDNCQSLTAGPKSGLNAKQVEQAAYAYMFRNTKVWLNSENRTVPSLPATDLKADAYLGMFSGCTSLSGLVVLPSTAVSAHVYQQMFEGTSVKLIASPQAGQCDKPWALPGAFVTDETVKITDPPADWNKWMFRNSTAQVTVPEANKKYYTDITPWNATVSLVCRDNRAGKYIRDNVIEWERGVAFDKSKVTITANMADGSSSTLGTSAVTWEGIPESGSWASLGVFEVHIYYTREYDCKRLENTLYVSVYADEPEPQPVIPPDLAGYWMSSFTSEQTFHHFGIKLNMDGTGDFFKVENPGQPENGYWYSDVGKTATIVYDTTVSPNQIKITLSDMNDNEAPHIIFNVTSIASIASLTLVSSAIETMRYYTYEKARGWIEVPECTVTYDKITFTPRTGEAYWSPILGTPTASAGYIENGTINWGTHNTLNFRVNKPKDTPQEGWVGELGPIRTFLRPDPVYYGTWMANSNDNPSIPSYGIKVWKDSTTGTVKADFFGYPEQAWVVSELGYTLDNFEVQEGNKYLASFRKEGGNLVDVECNYTSASSGKVSILVQLVMITADLYKKDSVYKNTPVAAKNAETGKIVITKDADVAKAYYRWGDTGSLAEYTTPLDHTARYIQTVGTDASGAIITLAKMYDVGEPPTPTAEPLCFTANTAESTVELQVVGTPTGLGTFEYSTDKTSWTTYTPGTTGAIILANAGDKVYFKGNAAWSCSTPGDMVHFRTTGSVDVSGDIVSLIGSGEMNASQFSGLFAVGPETFESNIRNASGLTLSPAALVNGCYAGMFSSCISLQTAPELPATTLAATCYQSMFFGCASLTAAPALPATTLASKCYNSMFQNCTSLTTPPALPATILADDCYNSIFMGCSNIKVSETQTGEYQTEYRVPTTGAITVIPTGSYGGGAFDGTGGTYTGGIIINPETGVWIGYLANPTPKCATPVISQAEGSNDVTMSCSTEGATIHYTDDGSTPTAESATYTTTITITSTKTFKAIAVKSGYNNSDVVTKECPYTPSGVLPTGYFMTESMTTEMITNVNVPEFGLHITSDTEVDIFYCYIGWFHNDNDAPVTVSEASASGFKLTTAIMEQPVVFTCAISGNSITVTGMVGYTVNKTTYANAPVVAWSGATATVTWNDPPTGGKLYFARARGGGAQEYTAPVTDAGEQILTMGCTESEGVLTVCTPVYVSKPPTPTTKPYLEIESTDEAKTFQLCMSYYDPEEGWFDTNLAGMWDGVLEYSTDDGANWTEWSKGQEWVQGEHEQLDPAATIPATATNKLRVRAKSGSPNTVITDLCRYDTSNSTTSHFRLLADEGVTVNLSGNLMTLLDSDNPPTALTDDENTSAFFSLFCGMPVVDAHDLNLTATTLAEECYGSMFEGCTSLTAAPALPATTLAGNCYGGMFAGCSSLVTPPELPVTTLAYACYANMFDYCTSLTTAPALPATVMAESCYASMLEGTAITAAPDLSHVTTLADYCFDCMFADCTSLTAAPTLNAEQQEVGGPYYCMFYGTDVLPDTHKLDFNTNGSGMFQGLFAGTKITDDQLATILPIVEGKPTLSATTLAENCYQYMFLECTSLTTAPALPATALTPGCYTGMFAGCTSLTALPVLPATTLPEVGELERGCYSEMFADCTGFSLHQTEVTGSTPYRIPSDGACTVGELSCAEMFARCEYEGETSWIADDGTPQFTEGVWTGYLATT